VESLLLDNALSKEYPLFQNVWVLLLGALLIPSLVAVVGVLMMMSRNYNYLDRK
jgi:hypothetical protein